MPLTDELSGLLSQLPRGLIVMTCGAGLLWLFLMIYFAVIRPGRNRRKEAAARAASTPPAYFGAPDPALMPVSAAPDSAEEMPDLDLLMGVPQEPDFMHAPAQSVPLPKTAARRLGSADVKLSDGSLVHANESLLILRDPRDNKLIVQIGDTGYKSLEDAPGARDALRRIFAELGQTDSVPNSAVPSAPRPAAPPPVSASGMIPGDLPKFTEIKDEIVSRGAFRPHKTEMAPVPELNIPGAIETYLQYKKSFTPEYAQRSIHVLPGLGGGVRIEVDGKYYDAVGDVEDPEVRAFLQTTIQEWQSRQ